MVLTLLCLAGVVAAIAVRPHSPSIRLAPQRTDVPSPTETDTPFPSATASDVVSYSDHVALVTAIAEAEAHPTTPATTTGGDRVIMRDIAFRVDAVLWSRPGAPAAPHSFTASWWGWILRDGTRTPFIVSGAPAVFVGAHYIVPIAYDGGAFTLLQPPATFRFDKGSVTLEEQDTPLARTLNRGSRTTISAVFTAATPDPLATRYRSLAPRARLAAVIAARTP